MQKISFFLVLFFLLSTISLAQSTKLVSTPAIWLRGDQGTVSSTLWSDESGNKRDATSLKEEGPVKKGFLNFNPVLFFDGENDYLKVPYSLEGLTGITMIAVFQSSDSTERGVWGTEKALSRVIMLTTRRVSGPDTVVDLYGQNENIAVISSIVQNWTKTLSISQDAYLALGSAGKDRGVKPFKGKVAEFMVFDKILGGLERVQIESYLAIKYGIPLIGNYVNSSEQVLWNAKNNKTFSNRITGIGRDDAFSLYQKQSKSAHDPSGLLTISIETLAETNDDNKSTIDNSNFLLWGDNGQGITIKPNQDLGGGDESVSFIERKWLMNVNGGTANHLPTELRLDISKLPKSSLGYWLVIDRSAKEDFSVDNLEYILPDSITADSIAIYKNVNWDTDLSGSDMFGFAKTKPLFAVINTVNPTCSSQSGGKVTIKILGKGPYQYELINRTQNLYRKGEEVTDHAELAGLTADEYSFKLKDKNNDEIERQFSLKLPNALLVDLGEDLDLKIAPNKEIDLDATIHIPDSISVSYKWESSHGFTSSAGKIKISKSGIYKVMVTNKEGCAFTDEIIVSGAAAQKFDVFPTPAMSGDKYNMAISLDEPGDVSVRIYDSRGTLKHQSQGKNSAEYKFVNISEVPGMYLVVLQTPKGVETKKIIVQ